MEKLSSGELSKLVDECFNPSASQSINVGVGTGKKTASGRVYNRGVRVRRCAFHGGGGGGGGGIIPMSYCSPTQSAC